VFPCSPVEFTDVSEDRAASLFRVGKQTTWRFVQKSPTSPFQFLFNLYFYIILSCLSQPPFTHTKILLSAYSQSPHFYCIHQTRFTRDSSTIVMMQAENSSRNVCTLYENTRRQMPKIRQFSWSLFLVLGWRVGKSGAAVGGPMQLRARLVQESW